MTALAGRGPVRGHLRPKPPRRVHTAADIALGLLAAPSFVEELNLVPADARGGVGRPDCGCDGWATEFVPLADAPSLPTGGEA